MIPETPHARSLACLLSQDARKTLRPLIRVVHPDLISGAPPKYRDTNAKSLALLHSLIDTLEGNALLKLAPRYELTFHARVVSNGTEDAPGTASHPLADWRVIARTLLFPPKLTLAQGEVAAAVLRTHIRGEIDALMNAAGLLQQRPTEVKAPPKNATSVRASLRNRNNQSETSGAKSRAKVDDTISEAKAFKSILHTMVKRETALPFVNELLSFVYGPAPTAIAGSRTLQNRLGGMAAQLDPEEADAAMRTVALFRSGRLLVDDGLSMADATKLLRRFGHACITHHSALYIEHPAWQKVVVILHGQNNGDGTSTDVVTRPFSSPLFGHRSQASEADSGPHDPEAWTLRVANGFSDMGLIRQVAQRFSPANS